MRILVFSWRDLSHPSAGGAEVYTHQVMRHWVAAGHEVTLFTSIAEGLDPNAERDGLRILRRGGRHGVYKQARRYYEYEGRGHFDLVIDQINTRPFLCPRFVDDAPILALAYQVAREVWFYEAPLPVAILGRYVLEPRWLTAYRSIPTITISASSKDSLEHYGLRQVVVVPPGCEPKTRPKAQKREDQPTIIYVGRLTKSKRPHHMFKAFASLRRTLPTARLWVVGSGPKADSLRRHAPPGVTFFGRTDESTKEDLLARAHVLVMTSVREGWGLAVTEAAVMGTPAVAYDVPGLRDSVAASGGFVVRPTPREITAALADCLPRWTAGKFPDVTPGGVVPWVEVAERILAVADSSAYRAPALSASEET